MLNQYKVILWDFDGVILDSMHIRSLGFREVLKDYPEGEIEKLLDFHRKNGGLSRYVKFRFFFEDILQRPISQQKVKKLAEKFSSIMIQLLADDKLLIQDTLNFIKSSHRHYKMHIVSGSDEKELKKLCEILKLDSYFISIHGSPTSKSQLVSELLHKYGYKPEETALIGDSLNDFEAAYRNNVEFWGYNNQDLLDHIDVKRYINSFENTAL